MSDWLHLRDESVRARKPHYCFLCREPIAVGERHLVRTGIVACEGPYSFRMHPECEAQTFGWDDGDWESFSEGTMERPKAAEKGAQ